MSLSHFIEVAASASCAWRQAFVSRGGFPVVFAFYAFQGKNQYEDNRAVCVDQYCQRTDVCKCLHLSGRRKVMGQRYSGVDRSREGILQDGKSGEFFPDIVSLES